MKVLYMNPSVTLPIENELRTALPAGWDLLTQSGEGGFSEGLSQCDYIIVADHAITASDIASAPNLKMIQHQGVGYEKIDLLACRERKIPVCLTPEGTSIGVAEHTILLILGLYKHLVKAASEAKKGHWLQWELRQDSYELAGKTLGLVGFGRIGREVAKRALSFEASVIYFDPLIEDNHGLSVERIADLNEFLGKADIVSLHIPVTEETRYFINAERLALMKNGAVLINTARGALVDEKALDEALERGQLRGAALDVLNEEPPAIDNKILQRNDVLVTPHIAAGTFDALREKFRAVSRNLQAFADGLKPTNIVPELEDIFNE